MKKENSKNLFFNVLVCATILLFFHNSFAWKPKMHVYLAQLALNDVLDDGKVTIYKNSMSYDGKIVKEKVGDYSVDVDICDALRNYPNEFRAGAIGPDAFPDIITGQTLIHPYPYTNNFLNYLWSESKYSRGSDRSFVAGFFAHAAADMYGHSFINYYAGGPFKLGDNALKHIIVETYIDKSLPQIEISPNRPLSTNDISLNSNAYNFIYEKMVKADPNTNLRNLLANQPESKYSIPLIFSDIKETLNSKIRQYYITKNDYDIKYREKMHDAENCEFLDFTCSKTILLAEAAAILLEKDAYVTANALQVTYMEYWVKDIESGLRAWSEVSYNLTMALWNNDIDQFKNVAKSYFNNHVLSMLGAPDALGSSISFVESILYPFKEQFKKIKESFYDFILVNAIGLNSEQLKEFVLNPADKFSTINIDINKFNKNELKTSRNYEMFNYENVPAAFNSLTMIKLSFLNRVEINRLLKDLGENVNALTEENVLLSGYLTTLDGDNQWLLDNKDPNNKRELPKEKRMVFARNGITYKKLFRQFTGDTSFNPVNLAYKKGTSQSSIGYDGNPSRAVDGNTDGTYSKCSVTHTGYENGAWWKVDLGKSYVIGNVEVFNRTDGCMERLSNYIVSVLDNTGNEVWQCQIDSCPRPSQTILIPNIIGQYVSIKLKGSNFLSLAEVKVYESENIALGKTSFQSSTDYSGNAWLAVDGNTDGNYYNGSVTHTKYEKGAWWIVDFGKSRNIGAIELFNRTDVGMERLNNYTVSIHDQYGNELWNYSNSYCPRPLQMIPVSNVVGKYVKVKLNGSNFLSLAEVKIFEAVNLAYSKNVSQSSTAYNGDAKRAVDGNVDGNYYNNSVTHTNKEQGAWWKVDLGKSYNVGLVELYNRTDVGLDRLSNFSVVLLDEQGRSVYTIVQENCPNPITTVNFDGIIGRYVKIELNGDNFLHVAEVKVFEAEMGFDLCARKISNYKGSASALKLPPQIHGTNVESIGSSVFENCKSLASVDIPGTLNSIGNFAFRGCCSLKNVTFLKDAPQQFGQGVFDNCNLQFVINYYYGAFGFTTPLWNGYKTKPIIIIDTINIPNEPLNPQRMLLPSEYNTVPIQDVSNVIDGNITIQGEELIRPEELLNIKHEITSGNVNDN